MPTFNKYLHSLSDAEISLESDKCADDLERPTNCNLNHKELPITQHFTVSYYKKLNIYYIKTY